jgi:uncharacterized protein (DUF1330 family)
MLVSVAAFGQAGLGDLVKRGVKGPIVVVDLVKFKPGESRKYDIYDALAEVEVKRLGGEVIFRGGATSAPPADHKSWDRVTFRKYPSANAVMAMAASKGYQKAFPNRLASVDKSFVYAFSGEMPVFDPRTKPGTSPMGVLPEPKEEDSVFMLNLLRFKSDGGREMYYQKYGAAVSPMIAKLGGGSKFILKGEAAVIADEVIDRLILVHYPDPKKFQAMIASDEYKAIAHFRTDAIELGQLFSFAMVPPKSMEPYVDDTLRGVETTIKLQTDIPPLFPKKD